ncbi:dimethylaniline monooxygenase [N-oxide-forming] [Elysia marginata]|uniref:Flavin-containing monooxygenase n=1 Tax=Elysia marginata TaxID=1093978 RepID=A0AAV4G3L7_9GAST|nr:dimethylaniline monooxygenase [N-oxide-forming] [Elysia marginata]
MLKDYDERKTAMAELYVESRRHTMQTFWIEYMDQVAAKIGAKPNLWKMLISDPELALKCYLGPCLPSQYRLVGDHAWPEARDFILGVFTRASQARNHRHKQPKPNTHQDDKSNLAKDVPHSCDVGVAISEAGASVSSFTR